MQNTEVVKFNDITFRRWPESEHPTHRKYFTCNSNYFKEGIRTLHREIWKDHYGKIQEGFHVHHKDGNTLNNTIENLECLPVKKHLSDHAKDWTSKHKDEVKQNLNSIRNKTIEWHRSDEGKKWHSEHAKEVSKNIPIVEHICIICGKHFEIKSSQLHKSKFCSNNCKSKHRRESGIDNIACTCIECGKEFYKNKYSRTDACSRSCGKKASWERKRGSGL